MTKVCGSCKCSKSIEGFNKSSSTKDGLTSICKLCNKIYQDKYRKTRSWDGRFIKDKRCSSCKKVYSAEKFNKDKSRIDGLSNKCKSCIAEYRRKNRDKLLEKSRDYNKKVAESNKVKVEGRVCAQCNIFKDKSCFWKSKHTKSGLYPSCIDCKKSLESTENRKVVRRKNRKDWLIKNREKARAAWRAWDKEKRKTDPSYKIRRNVMHAISNKLQGKTFDKQERLVKKIFDYLPYTPEELKAHIESKWESWMTWKNYGRYNERYRTWQIDHIIPQSKLKYERFEDDNFKKCWALDNLQPLETIENIIKGNKC